jgi:hypothetical protein
LIQTAIKVVTLGFFISIISGFVLYRSGFFDAQDPRYALQKSHNGGELNTLNGEQDSTQTQQIEQLNELQIMPSSKSIAPAFDLKKYEQQKKLERLPSTKVLLHPIRINPKEPEIKLENPYMYSSKSAIIRDFEKVFEKHSISYEVQTKTAQQSPSIPKGSDSLKKLQNKHEKQTLNSNQVNAAPPSKKSEKAPTGISWGLIGLGVLGIFFVGIGSIVYFKKRPR